MPYKTAKQDKQINDIFNALSDRNSEDRSPASSKGYSGSDRKSYGADAKAAYKGVQKKSAAHAASSSSDQDVQASGMTFQPSPRENRKVPKSEQTVQRAKEHANQQVVHRDLEAAKNVKQKMRQAEEQKNDRLMPAHKQSMKNDPALPQATPVIGHFNITNLTAMDYNRLIDLLLKEANHYDKMGDLGKEVVSVMENMVYTFSKSSSRFTNLRGEPEVLLTIMDEDFTNLLSILLKAAYAGHPDPKVDYSASLPYAGT